MVVGAVNSDPDPPVLREEEEEENTDDNRFNKNMFPFLFREEEILLNLLK